MVALLVLFFGGCGGECVPGYQLETHGLVEPLARRCADLDDATLCLAAGLAVKEPVRAIGLLERACSLGEKRACAEVARRFSSGADGLRDLSRALAILKPHCREDARTPPCNAIDSRPLWNVPQLLTARRDCERGEAAACLSVGETFQGEAGQTLSAQDHRLAQASLTSACTAGLPIACLSLGELALDGRGQGKSLALARSAFASACDAGSSEGCARHEELDLPLKGCNDGNGESCAVLGRTLLSTPISDGDRSAALAYWDRACTLKNSFCAEAGDHLRFGELGPDLESAVTFLRRGTARDLPRRFKRAGDGCTAGDGNACFQLGDLYYGDGDLVLQPEEARAHYRRGCDLGSAEACERLTTRYEALRSAPPKPVLGAQ
ncbi:MAG: tetratricopeptide repeat protein [Myxococcota bacterium]